MLDQGLSAVSNLLLSIVIARALDAGGYGSFAVAFLVFGVLVALTRAAIGQPLQITFSSEEPTEFRRVLRSAVGAATVIGAVSGLGAIAVGGVLSGETGKALIALGVCLPGLLVQDTCRMAFFSSARADRAAANDGLWTVLEFAVIAALLLLDIDDVGVFILAWGGSATAAACAALLVLGVRPQLRGSVRWLLGQRRLSGYLVAEYVLGQGLSQAGILLVGLPGTPADVGALRGAQVLLGPLNIIVTAASIFGIPEIARRRDMDPRRREQFCWVASGAVLLITTVYTAVLLVLPDSIGVKLLGDTWAGAETVLLPLSVLALAVAVGVGPGIILYGLGRARETFGLNVLSAPVLLVLLTIGIWRDLAVGAAWAIALTEVLLLPFLIAKARRAMREGTRVALTDSPGGTDPAAELPASNVVLGPTRDRDADDDAERATPGS